MQGAGDRGKESCENLRGRGEAEAQGPELQNLPLPDEAEITSAGLRYGDVEERVLKVQGNKPNPPDAPSEELTEESPS